ncbi:MAG: hypothetical protein U1A77_16160 [Pirellulales bacterium]
MERHLLIGILGTNILFCALAAAALFGGVGARTCPHHYHGESVEAPVAAQSPHLFTDPTQQQTSTPNPRL